MASKNRKVFEEFLKEILGFFFKLGRTDNVLFALLCWTIVIVGAWIGDFHRPPEFFLSNKRNFFNVVFAKWSLAWTLSLLAPFMALTYWMKSRSNLKVVCKHMLRLVVAFVIWYIVTAILNYIEYLSGYCEGSELYSTKYECQSENLYWNGYDISGHSFLLSYCVVILSEEIKVVYCWTKDDVVQRSTKSPSVHGTSWYIAIVLYVACCLLILLWLGLLAITSIYFHTTNSKLFGVSLGLISWCLTYNQDTGLFSSPYFPGTTT